MYRLSDDVKKLNPGVAAELSSMPSALSPSKYRSSRTESHGMVFDSGKEAAGVSHLMLLEEQHQIFGLRLQVRFPLPGHLFYVADACYCQLQWITSEKRALVLVVQDFKGFRTREYRMKRKLFKESYGIEIQEA